MPTSLSSLPNIGSIVEQQLNSVDINSAEELKAIGAKEAWLRIQKIDSSACINRLQALEGAVRCVKKSLLPADVKEDLRTFYNLHKL